MAHRRAVSSLSVVSICTLLPTASSWALKGNSWHVEDTVQFQRSRILCISASNACELRSTSTQLRPCCWLSSSASSATTLLAPAEWWRKGSSNRIKTELFLCVAHSWRNSVKDISLSLSLSLSHTHTHTHTHTHARARARARAQCHRERERERASETDRQTD